MDQKNKNLFEIKKNIIFITGVSGQVGNNLAKLFLENGCKVYGIDQKKNKIRHKKFIFFKQDITNEKGIKNILNKIIKTENKIDVIINNAAVSFFQIF